MKNPVSLLTDVEWTTHPSGARVAANSRVGRKGFLGNGVTIYPGAEIRDRTVVLDGAVIGRPPIANGTTTRRVRTEFGRVFIGQNSIIGAPSVIYTNTRFGRNVLVGDLASVREGCDVGDGVVIGRGVMVLYNCSIGRFSRIQDQVHLVGNMLIEEHVFIGMGVVTTNDNEVYRSRFGLVPRDLKQRGPVIRRLAVIAAGAIILPDVEIGEGAMVGAGAVVTRDVPAWTIMAGVPGRVVRQVPEEWRSQVCSAAASGAATSALTLASVEEWTAT